MDTYEKKYKEALEWARKVMQGKVGFVLDEVLEKFPELKESEDAKIRKVISDILLIDNDEIREILDANNVLMQNIDAWLENQGKQKSIDEIAKEVSKDKTSAVAFLKAAGIMNENGELAEQYRQGEQKHAEWHREDEQNLNACLGYIRDEFLRRWLTDIIHVKYDKPADKVEPKFKVGDIITPKDRGHEPWQIMQVDILDKKYRFKDGYVIHFSQEDNYELVEQTPWSEEDREYMESLLDIINGTPSLTPSEVECHKDWLKSLKEIYTWKPSDEQMHYLYWIANIKLGDSVVEQEVSKHLNELYKDLKKLKG